MRLKPTTQRERDLFAQVNELKAQRKRHLNTIAAKQERCDTLNALYRRMKEVTAEYVRCCAATGKKAKLVPIILLASTTWCFGQRGTGSNPVAAQPVVESSITLPAIAPSPVKLSLTWDLQPDVTAWRVQVGPSRGNWTGSFITLTDRFVLTNGQHYAVRSIAGSLESDGASLWPSNRIGELWLTGMGTNFSGGTNIVRLNRFTNSPPGNMQFWGVANTTAGWE
jgi:hypothetical protein